MLPGDEHPLWVIHRGPTGVPDRTTVRCSDIMRARIRRRPTTGLAPHAAVDVPRSGVADACHWFDECFVQYVPANRGVPYRVSPGGGHRDSGPGSGGTPLIGRRGA